eukprot:CAMPEP_0119318338 /NCGR_PEP_ID=MMETSP1333-20130426/46123_1 /TAXON_ID=418940 /ORGANISM="Scyphosphaera apsteinii, Strain RCC1455" /LENGTH=126 /DNA_ID=CAMNT_0007324491 /DNA_START=68 /DNA_END=448 /DNA_ORIENTATION=+
MVFGRMLMVLNDWRRARELERRAPEAIRAATLRLIAKQEQEKAERKRKVHELQRVFMERLDAATERHELKFQEAKKKFEGDMNGKMQDLQLQLQDQQKQMLPHVMTHVKEAQIHRLSDLLEKQRPE